MSLVLRAAIFLAGAGAIVVAVCALGAVWLTLRSDRGAHLALCVVSVLAGVAAPLVAVWALARVSGTEVPRELAGYWSAALKIAVVSAFFAAAMRWRAGGRVPKWFAHPVVRLAAPTLGLVAAVTLFDWASMTRGGVLGIEAGVSWFASGAVVLRCVQQRGRTRRGLQCGDVRSVDAAAVTPSGPGEAVDDR